MSEDWYRRRLMEEQQKVRQLEEDARKKALEALESAKFRKNMQQALESERALNQRLLAAQESLAKRIDETETQDAELRGELRRIISETEDKIETVNKDNDRRIRQVSDAFRQAIVDVREDTANAIAANNRLIEDALGATEHKLRVEINNLTSDLQGQVNVVSTRIGNVEAAIANLNQDFAKNLSMAREYEIQAQTILDEVRASKHSSVLLPERITEVQNDLDSANSEINNAEKSPVNAPVARHDAKQAFVETLRLRLEMVAAEQEWQLHHQMAQQAVVAANAQADALAEFEVEGMNGDTDVWSNGDYNRIKAVLSGVEKALAGTSVDDLGIEDLDDLARTAEQVSVDLQTTASFARRAILASDDRAIVVAEIAEALCERLGLGLDSDNDAGYEGEDQRAGMRARLKDGATGMEVVITIEPVMQNGEITQGLRVDVVNWGVRAGSGNARMQIQQEIDSALAQIGIPVDAMASAQGATAKADKAACLKRADMHAWQTAKATVPSQGDMLLTLRKPN